jgi:hypothetical protein
MSTLLHLLLWTLVICAVLTAGATLFLRWVGRRIRRATTAWLERISARVQGRASLASPGGGDSRWFVADGQASLAGSLTSAARVRVQAVVPGAGREVAVVRHGLRTDIAGAHRAVSTGVQAGRPVEGLNGIVRRLREQARALDVDLAVIASEPDRRTRRQLLAAQSDRVTLLRCACAEVRRGVLVAGSATTAPPLHSMVDDLNEEITALGLRARAYAELSGH